MTLRSLVRAAVGAGIAMLACRPAMAANPFDELIKPEAGSDACFTRVYDAAHLRRHPKQKTTAITAWLSYEPALGGAPGVVLGVALAITLRGDPAALYSDGGCDWDERANRDTSDNRLIKTYPKEAGMVCLQSARPDVFESVSAEEGGHLILDRGRDRDTLMIYLDDALTMVKRADRGKQLHIRFGADDRVFMLRRTGMKDCAAVVDAVTEPEPGVRRRRPARR
jgi:hypothetical protein